MSKIAFIFITTILLLWSDNQLHQLNSNELYHWSQIPRPLLNYSQQKLEAIHDPRMRGLILSYVFGINTQITKTDRQIHQTLNLLHLFSPSGLHISSILFIFLWMKKKKWKNANYLWSTLILSFFFLSLQLPGYYPLKRTLGFHVLSIGNELYLKRKKIRVTLFQIFLILMIIDFSIGSYEESPLSFTYSFLFWGIILSIKNFSHRLFYLGLGQLLVCYFSQGLINPMSITPHVFLSPIFSLLFPLIFFTLVLGFPHLTIILMKSYIFILEFFANGISYFSSIYVDELFIYFLILFFLYKDFELPKKYFLILLIIALPVSQEKISAFKVFKKSYVSKTKKPPEGGFLKEMKD